MAGLRRVSPTFREAVLQLGPAAYWPMDDAASPLKELVAQRTAAVTGSPTFRADGGGFVDGDATVVLAGSQYALASTAVPAPPRAISVAAWFRTTDATAAAGILVGRNDGGTGSVFALDLNAGHTPAWLLYQSGAAVHASVNAVVAANDGRWHWVVGTFDGVTSSIYLDGSRRAITTSLTGTWNRSATTANPSLGATSIGLTSYIGSMRHAFIHNDLLSASDVDRLWQIGFAR